MLKSHLWNPCQMLPDSFEKENDLHDTMLNWSSFSLFPRTALPKVHRHLLCGFHTSREHWSLPFCRHIPQPRPSIPCSLVPFPSSHHVCGVGARSLPQGWEWGAGRRTRQTPGEWCGGRVEPRHRAELPGGPGPLPPLWPKEDHPLGRGQDVRYAHLYPPTIMFLSFSNAMKKTWYFFLLKRHFRT